MGSTCYSIDCIEYNTVQYCDDYNYQHYDKNALDVFEIYLHFSLFQ
jgi:hypothetical protein